MNAQRNIKKNDQPFVVIIVLNWNNVEDTIAAIESLENLQYENFKILAVDNGSSDNSSDVLFSLGDRIVFIKNKKNMGYTGGNNLAVSKALDLGADYVWLFNNDARTDPDVLENLVGLAETDSRIGLLSPVICDPQDTDIVHFAGGRFDLLKSTYEPCVDLAKARAWQAETPDRMVLSGAALLIRRTVVEKIGLLDERFFAYWEDTDYSIRSAMAGFLNVTAFDFVVSHPAKQTKEDPLSVRPYFYYFMARNEIIMWRKFCSRRRFSKIIIWVIERQSRQMDLVQHSQAHATAILSGIWDGILGRGGPFREVGTVRAKLVKSLMALVRRF